MPLCAALLSVPLPEDRYPPLSLSPQRHKQKTLETLLAILLEQAAEHPTLLIVEDLHWVDPTTVEWLSLVIDQVPTTSLCLLATCRPEFQSPWGSRSYLTQMTLNRLPRTQVAQMVELLADRVTGGKPFPTEVMQHLVEKSDGIPLFVEEMTKTVLESDILTADEREYVLTGPVSAMAIPATLQDSLMARLDRLVTAKGLAQLGATLGRHFSYALLQAVAQLDEETLQRELQRLVTAELLYQRGVPPQATYLFKHALIQDVAYQSLLKSTRQHYHQRIAQVLETRFPEVVATQPELLAHHYTAAGCTEQAVAYWQRAGEHASDRSANLEAISHLTTGIELLKTLPETPAHTQQALTLYIALGAALQMTKGQAAPEVEHAYTQARTLCQQVGETPQLVPVLFGLWRFYIARSQLHTARELGETLLRLAQRTHDPALAVIAHYALGQTWFFLGALPAARQHLEEASHTTRQTSAVHRCSTLAKIRVLAAESMPLGPSGCWGTRSKPWPASTRPWRWHTRCRIPIVWRLRGVWRPRLAVSSGRAGRARAGRGHCRALDRAGLSTRGQPWERAYVGGRWPCRARARRGWHRSARGSPPGGPPGQR